MASDVTGNFVRSLESMELEKLPDRVIRAAKRGFLDYLGAVFSGEAQLRKKSEQLSSTLGAGSGHVTLLGSGRRVDFSSAVFLNGFHSHFSESDDGVIAGIIHPGTVLFSALLPWAEVRRVQGEAFLRGIVMGYETSVRLAKAVQPTHKALGYHATATCGGVGAAYAICSMLGETHQVRKDAVSSALVRAGGSLKALEDGSELKPANSAHAALIGHTAAALSIAGFAGPADALSGRNGFASLMGRGSDLANLEGSEGGRYLIEDVYLKPYASCRYSHTAIDAALKLKSNYLLESSDIDSVSVFTSPQAISGHEQQEIISPSSAKMSIPISVAVALVYGRAGVRQFTPGLLSRPEVISLARRTYVRGDDSYSHGFPSRNPAEVVVDLADGSSVRQVVEFPKGDPQVPLSDDELSQKFLDLAGFAGVDRATAEEIVAGIWRLPHGFPGVLGILRDMNHLQSVSFEHD